MSSARRLEESSRNCTPARPEVMAPATVGSEAEAVSVTVPERVVRDAGEVMEIVGLVVSGSKLVVNV